MGSLVKIAIVLFNLGGPDSPEAVQPFLRNLFNDPAILRPAGFIACHWQLPGPPRAPTARASTPRSAALADLGQTEAQARALRAALGGEHEWRGYVCMRYWHPMTEAVVRAVERFAPDRIVLLPLYPQFSTDHDGFVAQGLEATPRFKVPTGRDRDSIRPSRVSSPPRSSW